MDGIQTKREEVEKLERQIEEEEEENDLRKAAVALRASLLYRDRDLKELTKGVEEDSSRIDLIQNSKFAVILTPELLDLRDKCIEELSNAKYENIEIPTYFGNMTGIVIDDMVIEFKTPSL